MGKYGKILYLISLFGLKTISSQTVINDYNAVTAIAGNIATVTSINGVNGIHTLAVGDTVLIIQMQGATINQTNTASFGTPTINNAGNYEINVICGISGNQVAFKYNLVRTYTPAGGAVQIVTHGNGQLISYTVPAGGVAATPWNGTVGGVVFVKADAITMNGNVSAAGMGFRGGATGGMPGPPGVVCNQNVLIQPGNTFAWNNGGCNGASDNAGATNFFYPRYKLDVPSPTHSSPPSPATPPPDLLDQYRGGWKGEGIAAYVADMETGRGPQANGGGGGQTHNSGGAGGSLYGKGGAGGRQWDGATPAGLINGGLGGVVLAPSQTKLFMGGGGGGGHANYPNGHASPGANGGGIVLFRGKTLNLAANRTISADGAGNVGVVDNDSEGGGGAGGSIYLDIVTINAGAAVLTFNARGGRGGDAINGGDCIGTGGGGGGGYVLSKAAFPAGAVTNLTGGISGVVTGITNTGKPCYGAALEKWGAEDGTSGASVGAQTAYSIPLGTVIATCTLPIKFLSFKTKIENDKIYLDWITASEHDIDRFEIERSVDGSDFETIGVVVSKYEDTENVNEYSYPDHNSEKGLVYYRIKTLDKNGKFFYTHTISLVTKDHKVEMYPNPNTGTFTVNISDFEVLLKMEVIGLNGQIEFSQEFKSFEYQNSIQVSNIKKGVYCVKFYFGDKLIVKRLIVD